MAGKGDGSVVPLFENSPCRPEQPVVTTPVRVLVQTGNLQPRADPASGVTPARSAAFERSSVGLTAEVGGCSRPNHVLTHVVTLRLPRRFEFVGLRGDRLDFRFSTRLRRG